MFENDIIVFTFMLVQVLISKMWFINCCNLYNVYRNVSIYFHDQYIYICIYNLILTTRMLSYIRNKDIAV